jgi:hypothetical protein
VSVYNDGVDLFLAVLLRETTGGCEMTARARQHEESSRLRLPSLGHRMTVLRHRDERARGLFVLCACVFIGSVVKKDRMLEEEGLLPCIDLGIISLYTKFYSSIQSRSPCKCTKPCPSNPLHSQSSNSGLKSSSSTKSSSILVPRSKSSKKLLPFNSSGRYC